MSHLSVRAPIIEGNTREVVEHCGQVGLHMLLEAQRRRYQVDHRLLDKAVHAGQFTAASVSEWAV